MALTAARKKANAKYEAKAYDKTLIRLPKGRLNEIRAHIEPAGESLNGFISRAITETMERDSSGYPQKALESMQGAGIVSLLSDALKTAQRAAETVGEAVPSFIARAIDTQAQRDRTSLKLGINPATGGKLNQYSDSEGGADHE